MTLTTLAATTLASLADYTLGLKTAALSDATLTSVRDRVPDCVTAAIAGAQADGSRAARITAPSSFGSGSSSVWFSTAKVPASAAVLANCTAASLLDLDDGHRAATGHPGAAIIPSCLAVAEDVGASWDELVAAIVVGYEVAVRVAAGRDFTRLSSTAKRRSSRPRFSPGWRSNNSPGWRRWRGPSGPSPDFATCCGCIGQW